MLLLTFLFGCQKAASGPPAFTVPVVLGPVQRGPAEVRQHLLGELTSLAESSVAAETAGTVEAVPARVGSPVEAGSPLVQLDPTASRIALDAAQARLAAAEADVAGRIAARDRLEADRARLGKVQGSQPDAISAQALQEAELRLQEAQAALDSALATRELRRAEVAAARLELARCSLRSPVAGVVARQDARIGQRVAPGTVLVEVVATGQLEALLDLGEGQAGQISLGAPLTLHIPGRAALGSYEGQVGGVVPAAESGSRSQKLRVDLAIPPGGWLPGMAVEGEVQVAALSDAVQVPRDAVFGGAVFAIAEGKAKKVPVQLRYDAGAMLVVEADLAGVDQVVVRGNEALQDGSPVTVVGDAKP